MRLDKIDLNLFVVFDAVYRERNVTRVAQRLHLTQPAVSNALGRLRQTFDDPLFIRKSGGMIPTPRAEQLGKHLPAVLEAVQDMIRPVEFDPLSFEGEFELMIQGHMGVWIVPLLLSRLEKTAPGIRLTSFSTIDEPLERLAAGELDLVLHAELRDYPDDYQLATLGYASPVLLARKGHPLEGQELTWEALEQYPHIRLHIPELADIQFQEEITGLEHSTFLQREQELVPKVRTDHLYTAIQVVLSTDYLFPAPPLFMQQDKLAGNLIALTLPEGEQLSLKYVMVSHRRIENSPAHRFLQAEILTVIEDFRHEYGLPSLQDLRRERKLSY